MRMNDNTDAIFRSNGGWCKKIYFYASWALSCLRFNDLYNHVDLYTDSYGKKLLYDTLELPYTNVSTDLDCLESFDHNLWALGKIYTYSLQTQPFLHVDSDIYVWKRFDENILSADVIGQSLEVNYSLNIEYYNQIEKDLLYVPDAIQAEREKTKDIIQVNAGVMGGNDMSFFKGYTSEAIKMIKKNYNHLFNLHPTNKGNFNMVVEQFLAYCLYRKTNANLKTILEGEYNLADFSNVPQYATYIHAIGTLKKFSNIGDYVIERLAFEYPDYYNRILNLINKNMI